MNSEEDDTSHQAALNLKDEKDIDHLLEENIQNDPDRCFIDLRYCNATVVPQSITRLRKLEDCWLSCNRISTLPVPRPSS